MWNKFFETARWLLLLTENTQKLRDDLNNTQRELRQHVAKTDAAERDMRAALERLAYEVRRVSDHDESEREKLLLKIEIQLLRLGLPPASPKPEPQPKSNEPDKTEEPENA